MDIAELFEGGVLQIGIANEGEPCFDLPPVNIKVLIPIN